jgi:hypothetical protein
MGSKADQWAAKLIQFERSIKRAKPPPSSLCTPRYYASEFLLKRPDFGLS